MKKYILIGSLVFLFTMLVMIPASIASKLLPEHISANHYQGNLWDGSASSLVLDKMNLGSVKWNIKPGCFLLLKLCADIQQNNNDLTSSFTLKMRNSTELENLTASGDAGILNEIVSKFGITLAGDFEADLEQLSFSGNQIENINGDMKFSSLTVNGVLRVLLGDLNSKFEPQEEHTLIRISNREGHVDLSGIIQLFKDMSYELDMHVRQNNLSTDAVKNGMQFIGDMQSDGSVRLQQNGKLAI